MATNPEFYRGQAEFVRERDNLGNAVVLFKDQLVQGWSIEMPDPAFEEDGLVAVNCDGRVFILRQGKWDEDDVQLELPLTFTPRAYKK